MYLDPDGRSSFGDVIEAEWLFDAYVRNDSAALFRTTIAGGKVGFGIRGESPGDKEGRVFVQATMEPDDVVLTMGAKRMAIVLTDDCELATLAGERESGFGARGRILLASLRKATVAEIDDRIKNNPDEVGIHPLLPDEERGFPGGLVDFNRVFAVQTKSLVGEEARKLFATIVKLDREEQLELAKRWAGHSVRQGPIAAKNALRKFSQLLTADGDAATLAALRQNRDAGAAVHVEIARHVWRTLDEAWFLGGPVLDDIDSAVENLDGPDLMRATVIESLQNIRRSADSALAALDVDPAMPHQADPS